MPSQSQSVRQIDLFRRGGARAGAGRKPKGDRPLVPHDTRARVTRHTPVLVTTRLLAGLPNLRRERTLALLRATLAAGADRFGFRLIEYSIQSSRVGLGRYDPGLPQIRTCAIHASGSSEQGVRYVGRMIEWTA